LFALGGLQGAVGWWMVASGLSERVEVSQYRLATHLLLALLIFAAIVWTLRRLSEHARISSAVRLKVTSAVLLGLVFLQLYLGALVAGLRAGKVFNTWPLIDGGFIPSAARLFFEQPWWRGLADEIAQSRAVHDAWRIPASDAICEAVEFDRDYVEHDPEPFGTSTWCEGAVLVLPEELRAK